MKNTIIITVLVLLAGLSLPKCTKQPPPVNTTDTVTVTIHDTTAVHDTATRTLTVKPGPDDAQYTTVFSAAPSTANAPYDVDIVAAAWTFGGIGLGEGNLRTYIEFVALDGLPDSAKIKSATLSLYGMAPNTATTITQGNSDYPGSPYGSPGNSCWLKRVVGNWSQDSITWNNMPATTDVDEATIPASTLQWNNNATVDVTQLVQDIVNTGQNYGFCLQLQTEQIYRNLSFAGSRSADSTRWPMLQVTYSIH